MSETILKKMIHDRGMTVESFAVANGFSKRTLDPYVSGRKKFSKTTFKLAMSIADALNVDPHVLLEHDNTGGAI